MSKPKLDKTFSTFSRDPEINRAFEQRRDNDTIKSPTIGIYDVDFAIMDWLRSVIRPFVIENNQRIDVPVMYANGESWAQYQAKGFMYDKNGNLVKTNRALDIREHGGTLAGKYSIGQMR